MTLSKLHRLCGPHFFVKSKSGLDQTPQTGFILNILRFQQEAEGILRWSSVAGRPLKMELRETTGELRHLQTNLSNNRGTTWPPEERGKCPEPNREPPREVRTSAEKGGG